MASLAPFFAPQFLAPSATEPGALVAAAGHKLYSYATGTSTPLATYTDQGGGTANTNPITLDAEGRCSLWLGPTEYAFELKTPTGTLIKRWDDVGGIPEPSGSSFLPLAGGVNMTGRYSLAGPAQSNLQAVTLQQMTAAISAAVSGLATSTGVATAVSGALPTGVILQWSGSVASIPAGWVLCNGSNGTPDLRGSFIRGAGGSYSPGATGGAATAVSDSQGGHDHGGSAGSHTLTTAEIPAHTHNATGTPYVTHGFISGVGDAYANGGTTATSSTGGGGGHDHPIAAASGHAHTTATVPPYMALCFIMKTA